MLAQREHRSRVTKMGSLLVRLEAVCIICRKCEVSLIKDLPLGAISLRKRQQVGRFSLSGCCYQR